LRNQAVGVPGSDNVHASGHGGAIGADGVLTITDSTFTGNQARGFRGRKATTAKKI
jgi:hypothetical protein